MRRIFLPFTPPASLRSFTASFTPSSVEMPKVASLPVIDPYSPMTISPPAPPLDCVVDGLPDEVLDWSLQPNVQVAAHSSSARTRSEDDMLNLPKCIGARRRGEFSRSASMRQETRGRE